MDVFHLQNADMVRVDIDAEISGLNHKKVFLGMGRNPVSDTPGSRVIDSDQTHPVQPALRRFEQPAMIIQPLLAHKQSNACVRR